VDRRRRRYTNFDPSKHNRQSWALANFGELRQLTVNLSINQLFNATVTVCVSIFLMAMEGLT
jgi:hypothetical protein